MESYQIDFCVTYFLNQNFLVDTQKKLNNSCVKCVQIQSFSGPYFPVFELNTEIYSVRIQENTDYKILCIWTAGLNLIKYLFSQSFFKVSQNFAWRIVSLQYPLLLKSFYGFEVSSCIMGLIVSAISHYHLSFKELRNYGKICFFTVCFSCFLFTSDFFLKEKKERKEETWKRNKLKLKGKTLLEKKIWLVAFIKKDS